MEALLAEFRKVSDESFAIKCLLCVFGEDKMMPINLGWTFYESGLKFKL